MTKYMDKVQDDVVYEVAIIYYNEIQDYKAAMQYFNEVDDSGNFPWRQRRLRITRQSAKTK